MSGSEILSGLTNIIKRLQCNKLLRRSWSYLYEYMNFDNAKVNSSPTLNPFPTSVTTDPFITEWGIATDIKKPFRLHRLVDGPSQNVRVTVSEARKYYTNMQLIRHMDTPERKLRRRNIKMDWQAHDGLEACAVGMRAAMRHNDCFVTGRRSQNWKYLMGVMPYQLLDELENKELEDEPDKSDLMNKSMLVPQFYGTSAEPGEQVPMGSGIAFAKKHRCDGGACLTMFNAEESKKDAVSEAFNMASVWRLPCVFVCENNGADKPDEEDPTDFDARECYNQRDGIPGIWADGKDVLAVHTATKFAIDHALDRGPIVLQLDTSTPKEDTEAEQKKLLNQSEDPVTNFRKFCIDGELLNQREMEEIDKMIIENVSQGMKQAKKDIDIGFKELTAEMSYNSILHTHNLLPLSRNQAKAVTIYVPKSHVNHKWFKD